MKSHNYDIESPTTVAFTGGGTGGHIYPGLAIASCLKISLPSCRIIWLGSNKGMDRTIVEEAGLDFYGIPTGKLRRYFSLQNFFDVFKIIAGFFAARKIIKREKPQLLFSKGGFVSVPPAAAAASLKIPVFAHESDLSPGLAARINLRFVEKHFIPYEESRAYFSRGVQGKLEVSGNPVRLEFLKADASKGRAFLKINEEEPILLVLGGSSGSLEINRLIKECLPNLVPYYTVVHQCGNNEDRIPAPQEKYKPYAYFREELPHVIAASDLIICRGGAGTLWECAALHKPMVIIPLKGSGTRGDQVENAQVFEKAGAAIYFSDNPDEKTTAEKLSALICELASDGERRKAMASSKIGGTFAAENIAKILVQRTGVL